MSYNIKTYIMPTYGKRTLEFKYGKGAYLFSKKNKKYLDFGSGIAVNSLGHCNPDLVKVLKKQSSLLWHTSNLYYNQKQEDYARLLCKYSFGEKVFFTNSGLESIECGIKMIRSYHYHHKTKKKNIITFENAFHGRSISALSANKNHQNNNFFKPLLSNFIQVPFNNLDILEKKIDSSTAAIMLETIQGEGGVRPISLSILEKIKKICLKNNILLFLDEVQCGFGRSGKLFSYQWSNIEPDIMATAKGMGSGFPIGACIATNKASIAMKKGMHGSTFGGNNLAIAVGTSVIKQIMSRGFLEKVDQISRYLWSELKKLEIKFDNIIEVRGAGLLLGIKIKKENNKIIKLLTSRGLLTVAASDNVIRLAPPLIIKKKEVDQAIKIIADVLKSVK